jgi:biopolymer transport protein TolR
MSVQLSSESVRSEPNVTPMIDVMLVLLIIFMIVIPALLAGFNAVVPQGQNVKPHPNEDEDVILGIDVDGKFYLNKKPFSDQQIPGEIRAIYDKRTTDKIMFIKADKNLKYDRVMEAMEIASNQGVRVAALITDQVPGTQSLIPSDNTSDNMPLQGKAPGGKP